MSIVEKMVLLAKLTQTLEEVSMVNSTGVYMYCQDFNRIFGIDDNKFNIENWGGEDGLRYCTKTVFVEGVKIYAVFEKGQPGYCVVVKKEKSFETAAAELAIALGVE